MNTTILQVPVSKTLRIKAAKSASQLGFSSLQEVVRLFMAKLASGGLEVTFTEPVRLSPRAIKRYDKMLKEVKEGKNTYAARDVEDLMRQLNGDTLPRQVS